MGDRHLLFIRSGTEGKDQGVKVGSLGRQNERNSSYVRFALYLVCVLCQSA